MEIFYSNEQNKENESPLSNLNEIQIQNEENENQNEIENQVLVNINSEHPAIQYRKSACNNLQQQADKMLRRTRRKLKNALPGDCVAISVSEFDRGRGDPANIIGVILEVNDSNYKIGTKAGKIDNWLERNAFECLKYKGINVEDVPAVEYSVREIVKLLSVGNGQGFKKCSCKGRCNNSKCSCYKNNLKCNSACHSANAKNCINHDN